jgi:hypothetical protein
MRPSRSAKSRTTVVVVVFMMTALAVSVGSRATVNAGTGSFIHREAGSSCSGYGSANSCYYFETVDDKSGVDNYLTAIDIHFNLVGAYKSGGDYSSFVAVPLATPSSNTPPPYSIFSPIPDYHSDSTFMQAKDNFSPPPGDSYFGGYALPASSGAAIGLILQNGSWTAVQPSTGSCSGAEVLGVNDTEQGVGWYEKPVSGSCQEHAFEFYPSASGKGFTYVDVGPAPSTGEALVSSTANGINTLGDIVGTVTWSTSAGQQTRAWVYSELKYYQFSNGSDETVGRGINFNDGVVGDYVDGAGTHGFLVASLSNNPSFVTLDFTQNHSPAPYTILNSINTEWAVSGWYDKGDNINHGFVGTCSPCPNPQGNALRKRNAVSRPK